MRRTMSLLLGLMFFTCAVALVDMNLDVVTTRGSAATLYVGTGPGNESKPYSLPLTWPKQGIQFLSMQESMKKAS